MDIQTFGFLFLFVVISDCFLMDNMGILTPLTSGSGSSTSTTEKLGSYNGNRSLVSVSGLSAGGAMAVQFHVAYSETVMGMASFAGVAYHCSGGSLSTALSTCMSSPSGIQPDVLANFARNEASSGRIDLMHNMDRDKVFIWTGTNDATVRPESADKIKLFYEEFVETNIKLVKLSGAAHTFPTTSYGNPCTQSATPYISTCGYNGAYEALNFIYGGLVRPSGSTIANGKFIQFDQTEFVTSGGHRRAFDVNQYVQGVLNTYLPGGSGSSGSASTGSSQTGSAGVGTSSFLSNPLLDYWQNIFTGSVGSLPGMGSGGLPGLGSGTGSLPGLGGGTGSLPGLGGGTGSLPGLSSSSHSMDSVGFAYIPTGCQNQQTSCRVHIAFHGCKQGRDAVGDKFARHAGYNEVGEENDVIIIYPQVKADMISNPNGCFDWWGYADANFANKNGVQMKAVKNMIDRVTGP